MFLGESVLLTGSFQDAHTAIHVYIFFKGYAEYTAEVA